MNPGPTFERVYLALKEQLVAGRFMPGDHLEPVPIGDELNASITPVRDALHRLVGERLVEAPRHDGFRVPLLTEAALRHLYQWNEHLLLLALRLGRTESAPDALQAELLPDASASVGLTRQTAACFAAIARLPRNPELAAAVDNANDRLFSVRLAEADIRPSLEAEMIELAGLLHIGEAQQLRRAIISYHRRRRRDAPAVLEALHRTERRGLRNNRHIKAE